MLINSLKWKKTPCQRCVIVDMYVKTRLMCHFVTGEVMVMIVSAEVRQQKKGEDEEVEGEDVSVRLGDWD